MHGPLFPGKVLFSAGKPGLTLAFWLRFLEDK
jgi:hypothetical protein